MNFYEEESFWKWFFVILAALSVIAIGFAIIQFEKNSDLCASKGGTVIDTPRGYSCVKLEKVELKTN